MFIIKIIYVLQFTYIFLRAIGLDVYSVVLYTIRVTLVFLRGFWCVFFTASTLMINYKIETGSELLCVFFNSNKYCLTFILIMVYFYFSWFSKKQRKAIVLLNSADFFISMVGLNSLLCKDFAVGVAFAEPSRFVGGIPVGALTPYENAQIQRLVETYTIFKRYGAVEGSLAFIGNKAGVFSSLGFSSFMSVLYNSRGDAIMNTLAGFSFGDQRLFGVTGFMYTEFKYFSYNFQYAGPFVSFGSLSGPLHVGGLVGWGVRVLPEVPLNKAMLGGIFLGGDCLYGLHFACLGSLDFMTKTPSGILGVAIPINKLYNATVLCKAVVIPKGLLGVGVGVVFFN